MGWPSWSLRNFLEKTVISCPICFTRFRIWTNFGSAYIGCDCSFAIMHSWPDNKPDYRFLGPRYARVVSQTQGQNAPGTGRKDDNAEKDKG